MAEWKFYIETYGCRVNQYESEKLRSAWEAQGGIETADPGLADFILINSCAITGRAERNARNAVSRLKRRSPEARIILTGCAAQFYMDFKPRGNANWAAPDICEPQESKDRLKCLPGQTGISAAPISSKRSRPILKLQDGCSQGCAYCIVPQTRGRPVSRMPEEILAEAQAIARAGFGEIVLSGINLRQFHSAGDFWHLLGRLDANLWREFGSTLRLRISSLDPAMLDQRSLAIMADAKLLAPHLHLSIQHASTDVLRRMNRSHYGPEEILDRVGEIAKIWPLMGLGADFLIGFPGETEADMRTLEEFIRAMPFTYAHVFPYSRRQGTAAATMPNQITKNEKEQRALRIRNLIAEKRHKFLKRQLGLGAMQVVFERAEAGGPSKGINEFFAPCRLKAGNVISGRLIQVQPVGIEAGEIMVESLPMQ